MSHTMAHPDFTPQNFTPWGLTPWGRSSSLSGKFPFHVGILSLLLALCIAVSRFPTILAKTLEGTQNVRLSVLVDAFTEALEVRWDDPKLTPDAKTIREFRNAPFPFQFYWQPYRRAMAPWCESRLKEFTIPVGSSSSLWELVTIAIPSIDSTPGMGAASLLKASVDGVPLQVLNGSSALWKGRTHRAQMTAAFTALAEFAVYWLAAFLCLLPLGSLLFGPSSPTERRARFSVLVAFVGAAVSSLVVLGLHWFGLSYSSAIINLVPAFLVLSAVATTARLLPLIPCCLLTVSWTVIALKLPVTVSAELGSLHFISLLIFFSVVAHSAVSTLSASSVRPVFFACILMAVAGLTHIGVRSPYSYSAVDLPNSQYLLPLDGVYLNADLPHIIDLYQGYTNGKHLIGYSISLRRFLYEYAWSALWPTRIAWWSGEVLNVFLWFFAILASVKMVTYLRLGSPARFAAALLTAGSVGLIGFFGAPVYYFPAYAFSFIVPYLVFRYIVRPTSGNLAILGAITACSVSTYDAVPVVAGCMGLLLARRKLFAAAVLGAIQIGISAVWARLILIPLIGNLGSPSNREIVTKSVTAWKDAISTADLMSMFPWLERSLRSTFYAGLGVGFVTVLLFACHLVVKKRLRVFGNYLFWFIMCSVGATLVTTAIVAPEIANWSASGVLPRLSYYYGAAIIICVSITVARINRWLGWALVTALVVPGFFDLFGSRWTTMLFMFGQY